MLKHCFLDMDGVIADFNRGILDWTGLPNPNDGKWDIIESLNLHYIWKHLDARFWAELPPTPDFDQIIEMTKAYDHVHILSAPPPKGRDKCYEGKVKWLQKYLPQHLDNFMFGKRKFAFAGPDKTLIDDSPENIRLFISHGGNGILIRR